MTTGHPASPPRCAARQGPACGDSAPERRLPTHRAPAHAHQRSHQTCLRLRHNPARTRRAVSVLSPFQPPPPRSDPFARACSSKCSCVYAIRSTPPTLAVCVHWTAYVPQKSRSKASRSRLRPAPSAAYQPYLSAVRSCHARSCSLWRLTARSQRTKVARR